MSDLNNNRIEKEICFYTLVIIGCIHELSESESIGVQLPKPSGTIREIYSFDPETGNLISRKDNLRSLMEIFTYDNLNRLTGVSGPAPLTMTYSSNGNILSKTFVGNYSYDGPNPHAVTSVTNTDGLIPTTTQRVTCTSFNKADSIIQGNLIYTLTYGHSDQRTISRLYDNGILQKTVYYAGEYEKEVKPGNHIRQLHYIAGGDGPAAIFVRNDGVDTMYYIHTDHLGSINVITNQSGSVVQNYSFDAWGRRRNPADWTYNNVPSSYLFSRGFTGHSLSRFIGKYLDQFGLINMNGRIYDPVLGRLLSPDNYVQSPDFTQSFNRYSYCLNNPLIYTDPTGNDRDLWYGPLYPLPGYNKGIFMQDGGGGGGSYGFNESYYYDSKFGDYKNSYGKIVSWSEVYYNYVAPNSYNVQNPERIPDLAGLESWNFVGPTTSNYDKYIAFHFTDGSNFLFEFSRHAQSGGAMLQNEINGFRRIWNNSFSESTEYGTLITPNGLITFNIGKNGGDLFGGLTSTWKGNKCYVDFRGESYQVLGSVHVHWDKSMDPGPSYWNPQDGSGDQSAAYYTLKGQIPIFVLGWDNNIYSVSYKVNYTNSLKNYNVNSLLNGNLSLIRLLQLNP